LPAAVTVTVTALGSGGALRAAMGVKAHAAIPASSRAPWKCIFLFIENSFAQTTSLQPTVEETLPSPKKLPLKQTKVDLQGTIACGDAFRRSPFRKLAKKNCDLEMWKVTLTPLVISAVKSRPTTSTFNLIPSAS
jgi:hypothetical protein